MSPSTPPAAGTAAPAWRWVFALLAGLAAVVLRAAVQPLIGDALPFVVAFPAGVLVALRHGAGPGMLTGAICGLVTALPGLPPAIPSADLPLQLGAFALSSVLISLLCAQFRSVRPEQVGPFAASGRLADTPLTRWLQAVVWGAALIPLIVFGAACWWGYQHAFREAERAVLRTNVVVARHAERTLAIAADISAKAQALVNLPDVDLRVQESEVHRRLADLVTGAPAVLAISVWDADGQPLVSSLFSPAARDLAVAEPALFQAFRDGATGVRVTDLHASPLQQQSQFSTQIRRRAPDGGFAGVIDVSLAPAFFQEFYSSLGSEEGNLSSYALYKDDGALLIRWPSLQSTLERLPAASPLLQAAKEGQEHGVRFAVSTVDGERRLVSFQRLGGVPLYASTSLSEPGILANWKRFVALLAAVLVPITAGLVYVSFVALKKSGRERAALMELQLETQRRAQAERALLQSQKLEALAQLTGGVAHDFNNLLAIVNGNVYLLKRRHPELVESKLLAAIARAVGSGVRLTRQLLSFSRKQALNPEVILLAEWLPGAVGLLRTTLGSGIELQTEVSADAVPVRVDTAELELALINLAVNAKDAMPQGGLLRIVAANQSRPEAGAQELLLRVSDTGSGIAPELLAKVFEPFFTTKGPNKGTGLGLSQVYGFCVQAGGSASIESEPGVGTTVVLRLPAAELAPAAPAAPSPTGAEALTGRVLLVEDNEAVADAYGALLKASGLDITVAPTADAALTALEQPAARFDVVVSDIAMPGTMNGIQLAFKLRELQPALPVILVTGYAARVHEANEAGFRVLSKPVEPAALFAEIERVLGAAAG